MRYLTSYHRPTPFSDPFFGNAFHRFFDDTKATPETTKRFSSNVDVLESAHNYKVVVDLPGLNKDDVSIEIHEGVLTLKAKQTANPSEQQIADRCDNANYKTLRAERSRGYFERKFSLNETVNENAAHAKLENGVLEVTLPKVEKTAPKTLSVDVQ